MSLCSFPPVTLKRAVSTAAAGASSEQEFFARLNGAGVLIHNAVALPGDAAKDGAPVWFGGGKLAADLILPKLRRRWEPARVPPEETFTTQERNVLWEHATGPQPTRPRRSVLTPPQARIPGPTPAGNRLRRAARLLAASEAASSDNTLAIVALVTRLAALAEAVAQLRDAQQRAAQAASARHAAEHLRAARAAYAIWPRSPA
ncbi:MAG TPA: hypothetical protein VMA73_23495 [Streptosporangiaceae bacterium]|nr:hypothetical protein [Streptosporangiaceae bacterium]